MSVLVGTYQHFIGIPAAGVVALVKAVAGALDCILTPEETALCCFKVCTA